MAAPKIAIVLEWDENLVTRRRHNQIARAAMRAGMERHVKVRLERHFEEGPRTAPGGEYRYSPRAPKYLERKRRRQGHARPLVFTGKLRSYIKYQAVITATKDRARARLRAPFPLRTQRRREIEIISAGEVREIIEDVRSAYMREAAQPANRRQRRARIG